MSWYRQAEIGRCPFLDVLEEAAVRQSPVELELRGGERLHERIADVEATPAGDVVVLASGRRVAVEHVEAMTRAR